MRLTKLLVVSALVTAAFAAVPPPVEAANTPGWIGGNATVIIAPFTYPTASDCYYVPITGSVTTASSDTTWSIDLDILTSTGAVSSMIGAYLSGTGSGPISDRIMACYSLDRPGTYTFSGTAKFERPAGIWDDWAWYEYSVPVSGSFTLSSPWGAPSVPDPGPSTDVSKLKIKTKGQRRIATGLVLTSDPDQAAARTVYLERQIRGRWKVSAIGAAKANGRFRVVARAPARTKFSWRVRVAATANSPAWVSLPVRR